MVTVQQADANNNQSFALFTVSRFCIFDNRFVPGAFRNASGASFVLQPATLIVRDTANADGFLPATNANLANVIGIAVFDGGPVTLPDATPYEMNIVVQGGIDANQLVLPAGVTLNTTVGSKALKDVLNALGLHLDQSTVENTIFDNN